MAGATAPPVTAKTSVSLGPLYQQATDQAKAAIQPQIDALNAQQSGADATAKQRASDAQNAGDAASSLIASLIKPVSGAYEAAGQNQELAANGFSQGMQDALKGNTDNLNSILGKVGSPATLDSHASQAGDMLYSLGGFNPGTTFAKQGASAAAGLAGTASSANLLGLENSKSVKAQALLADQDFKNKIADLAAKLPGQIETNYMKLQQLALSNAKFAEQVKNDKFNQAAKTASQELAVAKYKTSTALSVEKMNQSARQFAVRQANSDRSYAISLAHLGIAQQGLQMRVAAQEFKLQNGGFSKGQLVKYNTDIQTIANAIQEKPIAAVNQSVKASDGTTGQYSQGATTGFFIPKNKAEAAAGKATLQITYTDFVKQAVAKGAPLSLVLERANSIFPETQRPTPEALAGATGLTQAAAAAGSNWQQNVNDYNQTIGAIKNGKLTLATGPQGQKIQLQMPKNVTPAIRSIINGAVEYLGTPYAWGGESPSGFDCSGLAQYLYSKVGVQIPRTTYEQFQTGTSVPKGQLQAGDLVFFKGSDSKGGLPGHVGIYIGGGQMINAPHTGDVVKVQSVNGFGGYAGARRYTH